MGEHSDWRRLRERRMTRTDPADTDQPPAQIYQLRRAPDNRPNVYSHLYRLGTALLPDQHQLTVAEVTERGLARLLADARTGKDIIVTYHDEPVVVIVSMQRLTQIDTTVSELHNLALVLARPATTSST